MATFGYKYNPIEGELDLVTKTLFASEVIPNYAITSFNVTSTVVNEIGSSTTPTFSWATNATTTSGNINSQSLTGLPATSGTLTFGSSITSTTVFTLTASDGNTTQTSSRTVHFVYAFRVGVAAPNATDATIAAMTKFVVLKANYTRSYTTSSQVQYYAYPASYGLLTSIKDPNNFEVLSDWFFRTGTIDSVTFNIYEFKNVNTNTNYNYTFIF